MDDSGRVKRRQALVTVAVLAGLVGVVILGLWLSDPARRVERAARAPEVTKSYRTPAQGMDPSEIWITRSEAELKELKQANLELRRQLEELRNTLEDVKKRPPGGAAAPATPRALPPPPKPPARPGQQPRGDDAGRAGAARDGEGPRRADLAGAATRLLPPPPPPPGQARRTGAAGRGTAILALDLGDDGATPETPARTIHNFLPAGTFAKAVMLSGLDAPTGGMVKTNPQPVLLRLLDNGTLPNRFQSRVRECFVTAAGYGDLSSERAYLRLEKLSCVLRDETVLETNIKGFVAGEDGKAGLRGRVVSKQGQLIAKTLLAGTLGGIGSALATSTTTVATSGLGVVQSVDPGQVGKYGVTKGFGSALEKLADWYLQRANEIYPIIEVDAGRVVEIVLNEGLEIDMEEKQ